MPYSQIFQKQLMMRKVLLALTPAALGSIYFFGWVSLSILLTTMGCAALVEWLFVRRTGKVSEAVWVTGLLLGLVLPPTLPQWMAALAAGFAVTFGKMAFGGFGANVFNPAMVVPGLRLYLFSCPSDQPMGAGRRFLGLPRRIRGLALYAGASGHRDPHHGHAFPRLSNGRRDAALPLAGALGQHQRRV